MRLCEWWLNRQMSGVQYKKEIVQCEDVMGKQKWDVVSGATGSCME